MSVYVTMSGKGVHMKLKFIVFSVKRKDLKLVSDWSEIKSYMKQGYLGYSEKDVETLQACWVLPAVQKLIKKARKELALPARGLSWEKTGKFIQIMNKDQRAFFKTFTGKTLGTYFKAEKEKINFTIHPLLRRHLPFLILGGFVTPFTSGISLSEEEGAVNIVIRRRITVHQLQEFIKLNKGYFDDALSLLPAFDLDLSKVDKNILKLSKMGPTKLSKMPQMPSDPNLISKRKNYVGKKIKKIISLLPSKS